MRNLQRKAVAAHTYVLIFKKFRARIQIQYVIALIVDSRRIFFLAAPQHSADGILRLVVFIELIGAGKQISLQLIAAVGI